MPASMSKRLLATIARVPREAIRHRLQSTSGLREPFHEAQRAMRAQEELGSWRSSDPDLLERVQTAFPTLPDGVLSREAPIRTTVAICPYVPEATRSAADPAQEADDVHVFAGGPGTQVAAALAAIYGPPGSVLYVGGGGKGQALAENSARYYHNVGPLALRRRLLPPSVDDALQLGYVKIDVSPRLMGRWRWNQPATFLNDMSIMAGNATHTLRNMALQAVGQSQATHWARSRDGAAITAPVLRHLEEHSGRAILLGRGDTDGAAQAVHLCFDAHAAAETLKENEYLQRVNGIPSRPLSRAELTAMFGASSEHIVAGFVYPQDGMIAPDMSTTLKRVVESRGNQWLDDHLMTQVQVDESGPRQVLLRHQQTGASSLVKCQSVEASLGPYATWSYAHTDGTLLPDQVVQPTLPAAGFSGYYLVQGTPGPLVGTQNTHFTPVAHSAAHNLSLVKGTGGGNIGSESIPPAYVINNMSHMVHLFGEAGQALVSFTGCPRAINAHNDGHTTRITPRFHVMTGHGGTGMTKCGEHGARQAGRAIGPERLWQAIADPAAVPAVPERSWQAIANPKAGPAGPAITDRTATTRRVLGL